MRSRSCRLHPTVVDILVQIECSPQADVEREGFAQKIPGPHELGRDRLETDKTSDGQTHGERVRAKLRMILPLPLTLSQTIAIPFN